MVQSRSSRLSPEYILLGFLYEHPSYGYELHKQLEVEFGATWHLSQSQTYNILKRLLARGDISSTPVEQDRLPDRQSLEINDKGRERFENWLKTPTPCSVHIIRVEFISRLYFIQKYQPEKVQEMIRLQREKVEQGLTRVKKSQSIFAHGKTINRLSLDLRVQLLESILGWLEDCQLKFKLSPDQP